MTTTTEEPRQQAALCIYDRDGKIVSQGALNALLVQNDYFIAETQKLKSLCRDLVAALKPLLAMNALMNDETHPDSGTYQGAYYAYYKGCSKEWNRAADVLDIAEDYL